MPHSHSLEARGIRAVLDLRCGQLALFEVTREGRTIAPYARVPWADGPDDAARFAPDMPPHLRAMSGDFFCAPFCGDDVEGAPPHGWPANAAWTLVSETRLPDGVRARFRCTRRTAGAVVEKIWTLRDDHPFLYQAHEFHGGQGRIPVAHHALINLAQGGLLRFSATQWAQTPDQPLEPHASVLRYPAVSTDLTAFPGAKGPVDLTRYPIGTQHEDAVVLVDAPGRLGWATALRPASQDVALLIKPVAVLPQTVLWLSNGGRTYAPWNGDHRGVLGIEQACAWGISGWSQSIAPNPLSDQGSATAIDLGAAPVVRVATALGALPCDATAAPGLTFAKGMVLLDDGSRAAFDAAHLDAP